MITENLSTLKIHKLSQAQYDRELEAGRIDENALYLTPDEEINSPVDSVNGKTGDVTLNASDIGAAPAGYGLGDSESFAPSEIDSKTRPGWYYTNQEMTICGFTSSRWWMEVRAYSTGSTFATQIIHTYTGTTGLCYERHKLNGTW